MFNVHTQRENVEWSTVPGPRSRGFNYKEEEKALKNFESISAQLVKLGMKGSYAVLLDGDVEVARVMIT